MTTQLFKVTVASQLEIDAMENIINQVLEECLRYVEHGRTGLPEKVASEKIWGVKKHLVLAAIEARGL